MKQKDIVVYVLGEKEHDWTVCYVDSAHVHQAAAMLKIVKLLKKDPTTRIEMFDYGVSGFPVLRLGKSSPLTPRPPCLGLWQVLVQGSSRQDPQVLPNHPWS